MEVTIQGRERVTLQRTLTIPSSELAPFHHVQGTSHRDHHAFLKANPKPEIRNLVAEREWRARHGHESSSKNVSIVDDITQVETVFSERRVVIDVPDERGDGAGGSMRVGTTTKTFSAVVPRTAPSAFYVAGGNWSLGRGYLAEIVYTVAAAVVAAADEEPSGANGGGGDGSIGGGPAAPSVSLTPGEKILAANKKHFLVTQQGSNGGGGVTSGVTSGVGASAMMRASTMPAAGGGAAATATRKFITGGALKATISTDKRAYVPGADVAVVKIEANCTVGQPCHGMTTCAVVPIGLRAHGERWNKTFEMSTTKHPGFAPGYFGERTIAFPIPPGWPASTHGALIRCGYDVRTTFTLAGVNANLVVDVPMTIEPSASMYSDARPAGAPFDVVAAQHAGGAAGAFVLKAANVAATLPPGVVFRPPWADDKTSRACKSCYAPFTLVNRRHHCRACGDIFCKKCAGWKVDLPRLGYATPQRVCQGCMESARRTGGAFTPIEEPSASRAGWFAGVKEPEPPPPPPTSPPVETVSLEQLTGGHAAANATSDAMTPMTLEPTS